MLTREGVTLTSSTIHRILLRYDLVREQDRHGQATGRFERERQNELWQMDFKGPRHWHGGVGPQSVKNVPAQNVKNIPALDNRF